MKKLFILTCCVGVLFTSKAQDIAFSQTAQTPLIINPALTGVFDGWERVTVNHRSQWIGTNTSFQTTSVSADLTIGKTRQNNAHLGLGLFMYNDVGGDANFGTKSAQLSFSGILPVGNGHILSAGIQGGMAFRNAFVNNLTFENQWTGQEFDQNIPSGEVNSFNSFTHPELAAGLNWAYDAQNSTFSRNETTKFNLGFSMYNLTSPELRFRSGVGQRLYRRFVAHTAFSKELYQSDWVIDLSAVHMRQGPLNQTILGVLAKYRLINGTKLTGSSQDAYFGFGLFTRVNDALIPTVMLDYKGFRGAISYDATISRLRDSHSGGSLEFSLTYRNLHHALFKKRRFY